MSIKTILVSLNDVNRTDALLVSAAQLASRYDAHLVGLYVIPAVTVYPEVGMTLVPSVFEGYQLYFMARETQVRDKFEACIKAEGLRGEWRSVTSIYPEVASSLIEHGRMTDLIIASQPSQEPQAAVETDLVERLLLESGRPILILPQSWKAADMGTNVLAGFNGTKESCKALFESIDFMKNARNVTLVWVDPYRQSEEAGNVPGAEMSTVLARHGITTTAEPMMTDGRSAGEALLVRARDIGADLIIMGAYAHSRLNQYVFGGATKFILGNMTLPVLMAH